MIGSAGSIRPKMKGRRARRWLVLSVSLLATAACASDAAGEPSTSATAGATSSPPVSSDPKVASVLGMVIGGDDHLNYTVEVPPGWSTPDGGFVMNDTPGSGVLGVSVWDVGRIPRDPCQWRDSAVHPGPTVDDLVAALIAQAMRDATVPTDVTLGRYSGQYLEWSVPEDMVVHGDADFKGCDVVKSNGHLDFISWWGDGEGERYEQVAGQVDRLWVLDVDGRPLVVDATYAPDTTQADRADLAAIAESLRFIEPSA